jgi:hypothetical protein
LPNARKINPPSLDGEIVDQLTTHTYALGERGVIHSKGNDYVVDAMRCAVLRRSQSVDPQYGTTEIIVNITPLYTRPIF